MAEAETNKLEVYIEESQISRRVKEISEEINRDYAGKSPIFIGVLNGAFVFLSDLIREINIDCEIDFLKLSSYGDSQISSGDITLLKELNCEIEGQDVIIVEDIIDSGLSIKYMKSLIEKHNPSSLKIVTFLYKEETVKLDFEIDFKLMDTNNLTFLDESFV